MKYIGFIHNNLENKELYGGKGTNLITLASLGINVPPGFILTTKSYQSFIHKSKFHDKLKNCFSRGYSKDDVLLLSKTITDYIINSKIPKDIIIELRKAIHELKTSYGDNISFAVRSSANIEDSEQFSFAGQAESFLNNKNFQDIIISLKRCWASLFSPQSLLYLLHMRKKGKSQSLSNIQIAVIIQKMLLPQCSGVLFTANVINNNRDQMMINSTWGLGDVVTKNIINPDLVIIDKLNGAVLKKVIGEKEQLSIAKSNGSSTYLIDMKATLKKQCSLTQVHLKKLYLLGLQIEEYLNSPQDIEWAIEEDIVYVLQSRTITTLKQ